MKGHTEAVKSLRIGAVHVKCSKQKLNIKNSIESDLVLASDYIAWTVWIKKFLRDQNYKIRTTIFSRHTCLKSRWYTLYCFVPIWQFCFCYIDIIFNRIDWYYFLSIINLIFWVNVPTCCYLLLRVLCLRDFFYSLKEWEVII